MNTKKIWLSDTMIMAYFALPALVLHLIAIKGYGYFRDELYYLSCADHPAFGYVDQPPLSILLLKVIRFIWGDSLVALRILPVLSAALFILGVGLMTRELGGKKVAIALACAAAFAPLGNFFLFNIYSMNFLDILTWSALLLIVLRIVKTGNPKYWLLFGLIAGLGLQNKISIMFIGFGIVVGLLLTKERRHLKSKYLWFGAGMALLLFLPYILWNMVHGWPTLEFIENASQYKNTHTTPLQFLLGQIFYNNPFTFLIWLPGLWYFFFNKEGKTYRLFGWMYLAIYILFTLQHAKDYYLSGIYPILFAGGAVFLEKQFRERQWHWPTPILIVLIVGVSLVLCPITLPILPAETTAAFIKTLGLGGYAQERQKIGPLPQHLADMHGWEEMTEKVAKAYDSLSPGEKKVCIIYGNNYGEAGAVNFFGKKYGLPPAYSGHNSFFFWPPKDPKVDVIIIIGGDKEDHEKSIESVTEVDRTSCPYCMPYENNRPIYIGRGFKYSLAQIWPTVKEFI
ncbi:MAG TPA: glycosyltransferase family 39 protein [Candidatus Deferrimicrobium sp.]|nr:glycosyltransferase family 39 protein [Candidatus Deferrimicrobium sp.]